ncbi:MAG TPA: prephenate dehydrogenase/arogenate dehydrogenase family protein [bacterium]|nr:prephenate dehydrogenase/arogenate dehydrogenase family protein [bacterium]
MTPIIDRLAVIGVGLIGGSFALALKEAGAVNTVIGCGRSRENLQDALAMGILDDATTDHAEAALGADVVMLAVPLRAMAGIARDIAHVLKPGAIVTDAGSAKEVVLGELFAWLPAHAHVVAGHPIAGSEKTGASAARADLFQGRRTILISDRRTDSAALDLVIKLWEATGSRIEIMDARVHDLVLGAVSHLPHMIAYALIDTLLQWDAELPMLRFSAGGLRDFTRIAMSSPEMWRDVCLDNKDAIIEAIDRFTETLAELKAQIARGDHKALHERFSRCREVRKRLEGEGGK